MSRGSPVKAGGLLLHFWSGVSVPWVRGNGLPRPHTTTPLLGLSGPCEHVCCGNQTHPSHSQAEFSHRWGVPHQNLTNHPSIWLSPPPFKIYCGGGFPSHNTVKREHQWPFIIKEQNTLYFSGPTYPSDLQP